MQRCGEFEQTKSQTYRLVDNRKRKDVHFTVGLIEAAVDDKKHVEIFPTKNYTYEFTLTSTERGTSYFEILADDVQISQSPLRVRVNSKDCGGDDTLLEADNNGQCVCKAGNINFGRCVTYAVFFPTFIIPLVFIVSVIAFVFIEYKRKKNDSVWRVKPSDLLFDDPPVVIGRGTFGLVLLSTYRGTTVAVKRVIPPKGECIILLFYIQLNNIF